MIPLPAWKHSGAMRITIALLPLTGSLVWRLKGTSDQLIVSRVLVQQNICTILPLLHKSPSLSGSLWSLSVTVLAVVPTPAVHQNSWSLFCLFKNTLKYLVTYPRPSEWEAVGVVPGNMYFQTTFWMIMMLISTARSSQSLFPLIFIFMGNIFLLFGLCSDFLVVGSILWVIYLKESGLCYFPLKSVVFCFGG